MSLVAFYPSGRPAQSRNLGRRDLGQRNLAQTLRTALQGVSQTLASAHDLLCTWAERRHQRRQLSALPPYLLHDIGLSEADAVQEATKPFWRD